MKLDNERTDPANGSKPFYDGKGYLRIPGDDYYDKDGRLHKMGEPTEIAEEGMERCESEEKQKTITEIKITVRVRNG